MNADVFTTIALSLNNFDHASISEIREVNADGEKYVDANGNEFYFYWVTLWSGSDRIIACTGKNFTALLGKNAGGDDVKLGNIILDHENEFEVAQATDEEGSPIFFKDEDGNETDRPLLKIQKAAHRVSLKELKAKRG